MIKDKDKSSARLIITVLFMLAGAALGSFFAARAGEKWDALSDMSFYGILAAEEILLAAIFLCGFSPGGSLVVLLLSAAKGFLVSAPVTLYIKLNGTSGYPNLWIRFAGGVLSSGAAAVTALGSIDMSVGRRYGGKTDASYFYAFLLCAAICAVGAFLTAKG